MVHGEQSRIVHDPLAADATLLGHSRFTVPVFPGKTLRIDVWRTQAGRFGCVVVERDIVVLDLGCADLPDGRLVRADDAGSATTVHSGGRPVMDDRLQMIRAQRRATTGSHHIWKDEWR